MTKEEALYNILTTLDSFHYDTFVGYEEYYKIKYNGSYFSIYKKDYESLVTLGAIDDSTIIKEKGTF